MSKMLLRRLEKAINDYGNDYILRHRTDTGPRDVIFRGLNNLVTPERSLADAIKYFNLGSNKDVSVRFYIDPYDVDVSPQKEDIIFDVHRGPDGITVPIKVREAYRINHVGYVEIDNTLLFLELVCNREEMGSWNR